MGASIAKAVDRQGIETAEHGAISSSEGEVRPATAIKGSAIFGKRRVHLPIWRVEGGGKPRG